MHCHLRSRRTRKDGSAICNHSSEEGNNEDSLMESHSEENNGMHHSENLGTCTSDVINGTSVDESNICLASLARREKLKKASNNCLQQYSNEEKDISDDDICLARLKKVNNDGATSNGLPSCIDLEQDIFIDSAMCMYDIVKERRKFKTFRTYGKLKWKTRKLSNEWETVKKTINNNAFAKLKVGVTDDDDIKMVDVDMSVEDVVNNTPKTVKTTKNESVVTPSKQEIVNDIVSPITPSKLEIVNGVGNPAKHSTPLPNTNLLFQTPITPHIKAIKDCSPLNDSIGFHRTISFTPMNNNSNQQCAISSLSLLKPDHISSGVNNSPKDTPVLTIEEKILNLCKQERVMTISHYVNECKFTRKIAEGSYGEVFERKNENGCPIVVKIVPVGSTDVLVNGVPQMSLEEVMSEIVINKTLSSLNDANNLNYKTKGFIRLHNLVFCQGRYPFYLQKLWGSWDTEHESENDNPKMFMRDQMYILLESDFCGTDLEHYNCKTQAIAFSILKQVVASLAVAEKLYQFEHRDLHWGNLLIIETRESTVDFVIAGGKYVFKTHGVKVSIIDFTVSRIQGDGCVVFTDLKDEVDLFEGEGDIQFSVYRDMKKHNGNNWESFNPYSNVLWVRYLVEKLTTKLHRCNIRLEEFMDTLVSFNSAFGILTLSKFMKE